MKQLPSSYAGVTISEATMREQDLLPKFLDVIREADTLQEVLAQAPDTFAVKKQMGDGSVEFDTYYPPDDDSAWDTDDFGYWFNEVVWQMMDDIAPAGTSFGAHEGDGACYGFWGNEPGDMTGEDVATEAREQRLFDQVEDIRVLDAVRRVVNMHYPVEKAHYDAYEAGEAPDDHVFVALEKLRFEFNIKVG